MAKELRITFKDKEEDLYNYIQGKGSASAFLKDLASIERKKEELMLNSFITPSVEIKVNESNVNQEKDIVNLDISDLD